MNILFSEFKTPYQTAPFSEINPEDFKPAFENLIKETKQEINAIADAKSKATFNNTIAALDFSGMQLNQISSIFFNLNAAETSKTIQKIAQEIAPLLSEFSNDVTLNKALFKRIESVYNAKDSLKLSPEENTLLYQTYKRFTKNGANLPDDKQTKLREIDKALSALQLKFGEHVLAETNAYKLHITNENDLSGLPDSAKEAAKQTADDLNKDGWIFTLDSPSYIPFMTYINNRELRKEMALAYGSRAFKNNENDNQNTVLEIVKLRYERANLLGYTNHAHFVLEDRMAKSPQKVIAFLNELLEKAKPAAVKELNDLKALAKTHANINTFEKWDAAYYIEKLKQQRFNFDDEVLKPYFKLENVINGVFAIAKKLYNLEFEPITEIDTYHDDVLTYKVKDSDGNLISIFYADFFPRAGKRNGAWMTVYKPQFIKKGINERPHISIVCNFTKPTKSKPSLLTFNEVTTLFHEFGHALHGMLANTTYPGLSGTNVYWDFVELPSQILENWCYEKDALKLFAKHYETNEVLPEKYIKKIKAAANFNQGMQTLRQLSFGLLDMAWHNINPSKISGVKTHELEAFKNTSLYPDMPSNCMSTAFSHIFQGGYSAGYYSYKWAEVLDADAFEFFKENGIFNTEVATRFKTHILSQGGTEHPAVLYKRFRGKEPQPEALLKRSGLIKE